MDFPAVQSGQGAPREHPIRGVIQAVLVLVLSLTITLGAFVWMTRGRLTHPPIDAALAEMNDLITRVRPAIHSFGGNLPLRILTDSTSTIELPEGALPRNLIDFLRSQGRDEAALPEAVARDPWNRSYLIEAREIDGRVRVSCVSAGPNGIFECRPDGAAAHGDDLLTHGDV